MPRPPQFIVQLLACGALAALASCASMGTPTPAVLPDEVTSQEAASGVRTLTADGQFVVLSSHAVAERLQERLPDQPVSVLALSTGGSGIAFGAGAIVGLSRGGARTTFSVVTGVSAGALVAPFAFLGPAWDAEVTAIYADGVGAGLMQPRVLGAVFGSSIYSGAPLKRIIDHFADDVLIKAVAAEADKGRLLLVATTDVVTGEPVIWDLGSIALHGGEDAARLFRTVLLASASVPGIFPPVSIRYRTAGAEREEMHMDGGVAMPYFISPAPDDLPASKAHPTAVYVLIEGRLRAAPRNTRATAVSIFGRGISAGLSGMLRSTLESTVFALRQRGISLDYTAIPSSYPLQAAFDFSLNTQRALFQYASSCAEAGRLWTHVQQSNDVSVEPPPRASRCPADDPSDARFAVLGSVRAEPPAEDSAKSEP
jgi:hypothetical protein